MRLLIRADGDRSIGIGHVMRTFALAERVLAAGGEVTLASARLDAALAARVRRGGVTVTSAAGATEPGSTADADWVIEEAIRRATEWVVVDGYGFDLVYQERLESAGLSVLLVDDLARCGRYAARIVLNQNVMAAPSLYPDPGSGTRYLLGPRFALLRSEFTDVAARARRIPERASRILVSLGGADPVNAGARILDALARVADPALQARVVIGPSNPHAAAIRACGPDPRIEILPAGDSMAPLMQWADLAITGTGGTVYELACLGIPTLVVAIAEYQRVLARALAEEGLAIDLGWHAALVPGDLAERIAAIQGDAAQRADLSRRGQERVDGGGADRVLDVLRSPHR